MDPIRKGKKPTHEINDKRNANSANELPQRTASSPGEDGEAGPVVSLAVLAPSQPGEKRRGSKVRSKMGPLQTRF